MSMDLEVLRTSNQGETNRFFAHARQAFGVHPGEKRIYRIIFDSSWRNLPPTIKQLTRLVDNGVNPTEDMTRGEASDIIARLSGRVL